MTAVDSALRRMTQSMAMHQLAVGLQQAIKTNGGVLVTGDTGSGGDQVARAIHLAAHGDFDGRLEDLLRTSMQGVPNGHPFVIVDCADTDQLEIRLFGALTRDPAAALGDLDTVGSGSALHRAAPGTLFLRQLPDMPARLQARLARVLRDGEAWLEEPAGERSVFPMTVRPIATSQGREDEDRIVPELRKRLEHTRIEVPPLRSRREDIPALVQYLLLDICAEEKASAKSSSAQATELIAALPWRGNVDELKSLLTTLVRNVPGRLIRLADVLAHVQLDGTPYVAAYRGTLREARDRFEKDYVAAVLKQHRGRMAEAAKALGIQRTNLYRKLRQFDVTQRAPRQYP